MKLLVFLQCAYGVTAKRRRQLLDRRLWKIAFLKSYTWQRLREMLPPGAEFEVANVTPEIGAESGAVFPPDPEYIRAKVEQFAPGVILACGKVAQHGLDALGYQYIAAPHPAWRALTKEAAAEVRVAVEEALGRCRGWG